MPVAGNADVWGNFRELIEDFAANAEKKSDMVFPEILFILICHGRLGAVRGGLMVFSNITSMCYSSQGRCGGVERVNASFRHLLCSSLLCLVILLSAGVPTSARADVGKAGEYQVKAAFIMNFVNFIEWPDNVLPADTITIGVLGRDPSDGAIDALKGKTVKGRKVIIRHYDEPEDARNAAILFISPSEKRSLPLILKTLRNRPVVTVGDQQGFARTGVMINMLLVRKRVGFEINLPASQRSGVRISSQLLKLAKEVVEQ